MLACLKVELERFHRKADPVTEIILSPLEYLVSYGTDIVSVHIVVEGSISVIVVHVLILPSSREVEITGLGERQLTVDEEHALHRGISSLDCIIVELYRILAGHGKLPCDRLGLGSIETVGTSLIIGINLNRRGGALRVVIRALNDNGLLRFRLGCIALTVIHV